MTYKQILETEINRLNEKYCKNTKNELKLYGAYGGYKVGLTGKKCKGAANRYRGLGSGMTDITYGYSTPKDVLNDLYKSDSKGWLKYKIMDNETKKPPKRF